MWIEMNNDGDIQIIDEKRLRKLAIQNSLPVAEVADNDVEGLMEWIQECFPDVEFTVLEEA